jgi:hypothetical protein
MTAASDFRRGSCWTIGVLMLVSVVCPQSSRAQTTLMEPFPVGNRNPLVQVFGLPPARAAQLRMAGTWTVDGRVEAGNSFSRSTPGGEKIVIDAETYRGELGLQYGFSDDWEIGLRVPWIHHDGGRMDRFIENWHDFWGLPNSNRDKYPRDQLDIHYRDGDRDGLAFGDSDGGIGDISLDLGYRLPGTAGGDWALRGGIKLPTGDSDALTGSGAADGYLGLYHSRPQVLGNRNLALHLAAGVLLLGDGDLIDSRQEDAAVYGNLGLAWRLHETFALKAQLDGHSAVYDSKTREIGKGSAQLVFGVSWQPGTHWQLDFSVAEDIYVDTAPDIVLQFGLRYRGGP